MDNGQSKSSIVHNFDQTDSPSLFSGKLIIFLSFIGLIGIGSGYLLSKNIATSGGINSVSSIKPGASIGKGMVVGSNDTKTFKDAAEGMLEKGGIEDEGQYHLVRPGGKSQYVYLTSSVIDLSRFVGRKVKIWGQTQTAKKAGWLMDAGRVEVLE